MNPFEKLMIKEGINVLESEFPAFKGAIDDVDGLIEGTEPANLDNIKTAVVDAAHGVESLAPEDTQLIEDGISILLDTVRFYSDLLARNKPAAPATA